jgi:hypothetical protein
MKSHMFKNNDSNLENTGFVNLSATHRIKNE